MLKKILAVSVTAFSLFVIGCGTTDPVNKDDVDINLTGMADIAGNPATPAEITAPITATIDANAEITAVDVAVTKLDGTAATGITVVKSAVPSAKEKITVKSSGGDMTISLKIATTTVNGTYVYTLSAAAGGSTSSKSDTIVLSGMTAASTIVTDTIIAGANKNIPYGSSIDIDGGVAYKMTDAATNLAKIDLCYAHTASGDDKLGTPTWAKLSGYDFAKDWVNPPTTMKFYKTALTAAEFDAITVIPAFVDASATAESAVAVKDAVFIVKTTEGAVFLLKIMDQVAGEAGTITIKTAK